MRHKLLRAAATVLLISLAAAAAPTTQPAADASTPKAALRSFAIATRTGNRESLRASFHAATPTEERLADLTAEVAAAVVRLRDAAVAKFGDAGAKQFNGNIPDDAHLARIDSASEQVNDDTATVLVQGADGKLQSMYLVRIDGKWKISVSRAVAGTRPDKLETQLSTLTLTSKILDEVTAEIARGDYRSADDATDALKSKITRAYLMQARQPKGRQARSR
jgi:hypothetical protein